jgi:hypothetical protein
MADQSSAGASETKTPGIVQTIKLPETALIVALMLYFGWVWTSRYYQTLGIPFSVLNFANQDFILKSVAVLSGLLPRMGIALLVIVFAQYLLGQLLQRLDGWHLKSSERSGRPLEKPERTLSGRAWRWLLPGLEGRNARRVLVVLFAAIGIALVLISFFPTRARSIGILLDAVTNNLVFAAGFGLILESLWLAGQLPLHGNRPETVSMAPTHSWTAYSFWIRLIVVALIVDGLFIAVAWYADENAVAEAQRIINCPFQQPAATVYSNVPLTNEMTNVSMAKLSDDGQTYQYRYKGLRFIVHSNGEYFFLPETKPPVTPTLLILPDAAAIHVELSPGSACSP